MKAPRSARALDPTLEPIFLLAGCAARRSALRERAREALARADHGRLAAELSSRRLLPLIGTRALEVGADVCPPSFHAAVKAARTAARASGLAVEAETRRVAARLGDRGIRAVPLKGPLLATEAHGDIGLRETDDVDLLVPRSRLRDASHLLEEEGFGEPADPVRANGLPDVHFALDHPTRPSVELHWRVYWYEEAFSDEMLAHAERGPGDLLRARPDDLVVALLLFYARDGFYGIRLAADVAAWWDRHSQDVAPRFLEDHARRHPELAPALTAAAAAVVHVTGAPASEWIGNAAAGGRRVELATRLTDWTQAGERDQLAANISLVDGLLGPPGSARAFALRQLVPRSGAALPHALKTLARWATGLWRVRGGRWWSGVPAA